ncbi:MAG: cofactor assembly of complex C subunit B [Synechococcales cyanobacterium RM1_1_8]|nr:cofactor assembly of complex C subunit B [Synechococcales cyanobacterium RM1_1_8]
MAPSDSSPVLQRLPLVVGALGGMLLLINRAFTPVLVTSQSRSDALGIILSALLILTGLLWQRVQPKLPEAVELVGSEGFDLDESLPEAVKLELAWVTKLLLTNTATRSLLIWYDDRVIARRGILVEREMEEPGIIVDRVMETEKPVYLVDLKLYPGRIEFDYLPENIQGLICHPLTDPSDDGEESRGALILAANAPRSYSEQDEAWIEAMAQKLSQTLAQSLEA